MRKEDRERALVEVVCRVLGDTLERARAGGPAVEQVIHDTVYEEKKRLDAARRGTPRRDEDRAALEDLRHRLRAASAEEEKALLRGIIQRFAEEIAGRFDPRIYAFATSLVPKGLGLLLNALSPTRLLAKFPELPQLSANVIIRGEVDTIRRLDELGTVILCPTHLSNLDSPVVGWALHAVGLPPYVYGAGINLFTNPVLSFFMHNLGAYRVDRKKTAELYKEVLKAYCTVTLEYGYDNLFFPGGTRSRSGAIEPRLKLGLLGCGLRAYVNNLRAKKPKPNIYVVPCTLSYGLTLEAETLIDDYLKETGKARYIIEDDESSRLASWLRFLSGVATMDSRIYLTFSAPLDLVGNRVEADGVSYDRRGRPIDMSRYVIRDGQPVHDGARDAEYTKELGDQVIAAFRRDNVLQSTHLAAFTMFSLLRRQQPSIDLYRLLRLAGDEATVPWRDLCEALGRVLERTRRLSDEVRVRLDPRLRALGPEEVLEHAIGTFGSYHARPAIFRRGDRAFAGDMNLAFYYSNRATGYGLEHVVDERPEPPAIDLARRPSGEPLMPSRQSEPPQRLQAPERPVGARAPAPRPEPEAVGVGASASSSAGAGGTPGPGEEP